MRDTRYDVWGLGGRSCCQGAVQEIELVPKTEVGADPKLNRGGRPPYRTIWGSTLVPVQLPAAVPIVSYKSSVFGTGASGERLPFSSYESSVFGSGLSKGEKRPPIRGRTATCGVPRTALGAHLGWGRHEGAPAFGNTQGLESAVTDPYPRRSSRNSDAGSTPVTRR